MTLKLFIWTDFCPDYSGGLAFAIAENEMEAKDLVREESNLDWIDDVDAWGDLEVRDISPVARSITGEDNNDI